MKSLVGVGVCSALFLNSFQAASADTGMERSLASTSYYTKAYTCTASSSWTNYLSSESNGYSWVKSVGEKGYVKNSSGTLLGVVLNDTSIDFSYSYLIKRGSTGSKVSAVQKTLNCLGYNAGTVDGIFGSQTEAAVKAFQRDKGLAVDGIVGKNTYYYLSFSK